MTKTTDLKPCECCGGSIVPFFYRVEIKFRQVMVDHTAVNQVLGTAQILGGNLALGALMSPNQEVLIEMPGYQIDKDIWLCQECVMDIDEPCAIFPSDWIIEADEALGNEQGKTNELSTENG